MRISYRNFAQLLRFLPRNHFRFVHCVGCGSDLDQKRFQREHTNLKRTEQVTNVPPAKSVQDKINERLNTDWIPQMSVEQLEALNWHENSVENILKHERQRQLQSTKSQKKRESRICNSCLMTREGTIADIRLPKLQFTEDVNNKQQLIHVMDALDFPLGIPAKNFDKDDIFAVNRCDLLVAHASQLSLLKRYVMLSTFKKLDIKESNVVLVSALQKWNLDKLSERLGTNKNYFVGPPNSGKTQLVHVLSGIDRIHDLGASTWPLPFSTQEVSSYKSLPEYRSKTLVDTPSLHSGTPGLSAFLPPRLARKVGMGFRMIERTPKYGGPQISGKTGQFVSIGGLIALEFPALPDRRIPFHVFCSIGGIAHTEFGQSFKDLSTIEKINTSDNPNHTKMRMHAASDIQLVPKLEFEPVLPSGERQSAVIKGLGFLQPFVFGRLPESYKVKVWAPESAEVGVRLEVLPYLTNSKPHKSRK